MTQQQQPAPPIPPPVSQPESDFYWEKCKAHELWLRRIVMPATKPISTPGTFAPNVFRGIPTGSRAADAAPCTPSQLCTARPHPSFRDKVPFVVAIVEVEDGSRIPTNLVGVEPDPANIKMRHGPWKWCLKT